MNGIEACREILGRPSDHSKPKIIFVTAHVADEFESECKSAGGIDFIPKPVNLGVIESCLRRHFCAID
jgi:CheY-like chemotaxis protein